jgi:tetratricopeptide (TPR) repeat protein
VQNEIAQKVVDQLGGSLTNQQIQKETPTSDLAAYDFYLRGLAYEHRGTYAKSDIQNSIGLFKKAIDVDPGFALAYAHLSKNMISMYWFYFDRSEKNIKEAYNYAQQALKLNSNLADTYLALGYYYYWYKLDYTKAIEEFSQALKIQPNNAEAFSATGYVYRRMGNFDLAIQNMVKGSSLDPLSSEYWRNAAQTYGLIRNYKNADQYFNRVNELNPDLSYTIAELAENYINWKGDTKKASEILQKLSNNQFMDNMYYIPAFVDILNRNYDQAIEKIKTLNNYYESSQFRYTPTSLEFAFIYKYKKQPELSQNYFESSKTQLEKMLKANPADERLHSSLGITYAGLGLKDKAVAEGRKGIELMPLEKEAFRGYYRQWDMAIIYTLLGDNDDALKKIDYILSIPGAFSVNQLKLDPLYDSLRNLPGYKAIVDKYSK